MQECNNLRFLFSQIRKCTISNKTERCSYMGVADYEWCSVKIVCGSTRASSQPYDDAEGPSRHASIFTNSVMDE